MSKTCPVCGQGHLVAERLQASFDYGDAVLSAEQIQEYCDACGTLVQKPSTLRANVRNRQRARLQHDGYLFGEQIRSFREAFHLTQKQAGDLFGGGPTAFAKYEADEIAHTVAMDRLLRLCIADPRNLKQLAHDSGVTLPAKTIEKIELATRDLLMETIRAAALAFSENETGWPAFPAHCANDRVFEQYGKVRVTRGAAARTDWTFAAEGLAA